MSIQSILVVDDDALSREFLTEALRSLGYRATAVAGAADALDRAARREVDLVLSDVRMPGMDGMELVRRLADRAPGLPVVLVTAHGTVETAVEGMRFGAADFLVKPVTLDALSLVIDRTRATERLRRENEYLRAEAMPAGGGELVATSPAMLDVLASATRIAGTKGTVLITGESGTGKERVAHHVHARSPRAGGPFIRVNCAALSETLLESELFGHERGAFTGAVRRREGRFELADGGTLLLDEIGEISPALQAKLLRVLEEEEFERVGGTSTIRVDVRVIATTNRHLPAEVAAGRFREDLYYRLHVFPLEIAPLRERPEDVLPLAEHFARHHALQAGLPEPSLGAGARHRLEAWHWPGNVRELENLMQRSVVLAGGGAIEAGHLLFGPSGTVGRPEAPAAAGAGAREAGDPSEALRNRPLADIEREAILATLEDTGGNKSEAARRLGVTARTLSNKMKLWRQLGLVA